MSTIFQQPGRPIPTVKTVGAPELFEGFHIVTPSQRERTAVTVHDASSATRFLEHAQESRRLALYTPKPEGISKRVQKFLRAKIYGQWTRLIDEQILDEDLKAKLHDVCDNSALKLLDGVIREGSEKRARDVQTLLHLLARIIANPNGSAEFPQLMHWLEELCVEMGLNLTVMNIRPGLVVPQISASTVTYSTEDLQVMVSVQRRTQRFNAQGFLYNEVGQPRTPEQYRIFWEDVVQLIPEQYLPQILFQFLSVQDLIDFIKAVYVEGNEDHFLNLRLAEALLGMRDLEYSTHDILQYTTEDLWHHMLADSNTQAIGTALLITCQIYGTAEQSRDMMDLYEILASHHLGEWHQSFHHVIGDMALAPTAKPAGFVILSKTHEWAISHNTLEERFIIAYRGLGSPSHRELSHALQEAEFLLRDALRLTRSQKDVLAARVLALMDRDYSAFKPLLKLLAIRLHDESELKGEVLDTLRIRALLDAALSRAHYPSDVESLLRPYLIQQNAHSTYALQKGIEWSLMRNLDSNIHGHAMSAALGLSRAGAGAFSRIPNVNYVSFAGLPLSLEQARLVISSRGSIKGVILVPTSEELLRLDQNDLKMLQDSSAQMSSAFIERMFELNLILPKGLDLSQLMYNGRKSLTDEQLLWCLRNGASYKRLGVSLSRLSNLEFLPSDSAILTRLLNSNRSQVEITGRISDEHRIVQDIIRKMEERLSQSWFKD